MEIDYDQIHSEVLLKSKSYNFINEQINLNGIIKIKKTKLDFFSFFLKMIISQQISDNLAGKIWKKFCSILNSQNPTIQKISNKKHLLYCVSNLKISKRKIDYIISFYDLIVTKKIMINRILTFSEKDFKNELCKYKGIGPWTCDMFLIFFLRRQNIFPENDLIIKKTKERLIKLENSKIDFRKKFSPYLSIFSLHLWKMAKRIL